MRLQQGDMARATVFNRDPAAQAHSFEAQGFEYLHVVDLDGAFAGKPMNAAAVDRILEAVSVPLQLGGGIRDRATVAAWLEKGVTRVIIGTAAVRDPPFVRAGGARVPGPRRGRARCARRPRRRRGLGRDFGADRARHRAALRGRRRCRVVYTDVARDGMLTGLNLDATLALAEAVSIPVIASGGLASLDDVQASARAARGKLAGAIAGRALYDGRLDAAAALALIGAMAARRNDR